MEVSRTLSWHQAGTVDPSGRLRSPAGGTSTELGSLRFEDDPFPFHFFPSTRSPRQYSVPRPLRCVQRSLSREGRPRSSIDSTCWPSVPLRSSSTFVLRNDASRGSIQPREGWSTRTRRSLLLLRLGRNLGCENWQLKLFTWLSLSCADGSYRSIRPTYIDTLLRTTSLDP